MIEFRNVSVDFPHAEEKNAVFHAVQDVSLQVERGNIYGIVGHSGAGKSTLLRTVNQLQKLNAGELIVNG